uniref:Phospho-N-acetylmuramoyl-pentapeptidetransferase n=1 Tax=Paulinella chromatophora TaxID=39717 RepID=B1X4H1_PAUCH|nr:Phospho-N-acetylmuramoyl-pentapeptidetransferase [Paulinella chromatophora]ACB42840.1 Phospho-N-acetylmuramoyl-pentapeptidetransferase [Paulinella chromatophora]
MNNSPLTNKTNETRFSGKFASAILISFIITTFVIIDILIPDSTLTIPLVASAVISGSICNWFIPLLSSLKMGQIIRIDGPISHYSKANTPTMGGLLIIPVGVVVGNLFTLGMISHERIIVLGAIILSYMVIGSIDDLQSLNQNINTGLLPHQKIKLQSIAAILFMVWASWFGWISTDIALPSVQILSIKLLIWPLALFVFLAESNATNLTDGLDGLAAGCSTLVFSGLTIQLILRGNLDDTNLASFCAAMTGSWLGFLTLNRNPARIFMGDAGSLALGAGITGIALISNNLWPLLLTGGIFLIESICVIMQVAIFRVTRKITGKGKRLFEMAPLHHHFELRGVKEEIIVLAFWLVSLFLAVTSLLPIP